LRKVSHVYSLSGQMYSIIGELFYLLTIVFVFSLKSFIGNVDPLAILLCCKIMGFGLLSTVKVLSSREPKQSLKLLLSIK